MTREDRFKEELLNLLRKYNVEMQYVDTWEGEPEGIWFSSIGCVTSPDDAIDFVVGYKDILK